jgi:hypothetical protein
MNSITEQRVQICRTNALDQTLIHNETTYSAAYAGSDPVTTSTVHQAIP